MPFDPITLASAIFASVVGPKTKELLDEVLEKHTPNIVTILQEQTALLTKILDQSSSEDNPDMFETISLQADALQLPGAGSCWLVPAYPRNHLMALIGPGAGVWYYQVPGMKVTQKSIGTSGWYQLDFPPGTLISVSSSQTTVMQWSDFAHGTSF